MYLSKSALKDSFPISQEAESTLFKQLFQKHAPGIYRAAYAQLRSHAEAQEIVQDCFLKFWEKRRKVSPDPLAIRSYLYTSAYHAALNQLRRQKSWVYQDYPEDLIVENTPQAAALEYEELNICYSQALTKLPAKRREIFALSRQQGLSNTAIAQELNISIKTVEAQITHTLRFLRTYFQAHGISLSLVVLMLSLY